jgi:hypothetical protein
LAQVWRGGRLRVVLGGIAVASLAVAGFALHQLAQSEPTPWNKPAKVEGDVAHLRYIGSQCQEDASVDVEQDDREVILTVLTPVRTGDCPDVGVPYSIDVKLGAALGERELIDGACLIPELAHYAACHRKRTH